MKHIITDDPQTNTEVMFNLAYVKDKEVWIHGAGEDQKDCSLVDFTKNMCSRNHLCSVNSEMEACDDLDALCDWYMDCSMSGCPIGTAYFIAIQAAELRERLRQYEDANDPAIDEPILLENQHKPYGISTNANSPWISRCPKCGKKVEGKQTKFCKYCGQAVKWE